MIIPTYNEIENIGDIISAVLSQGSHFHILIVDDNSPDGTASLVLERKADLPDRIHLLQRSGKLGLGTAYIAGFQFGLNHQYDYLFEMDADFSHDPKDLNRLLDGCLQKNADFAIGSRYVKGGGISNWPRIDCF